MIADTAVLSTRNNPRKYVAQVANLCKERKKTLWILNSTSPVPTPVHPWQADQILAKDAQFPTPLFDSPVFDMDYISLGMEIEKMRTESVKGAGSTTGSTMSAGTSIASSECSDEACVEYDGDSDSLFAVSEDQDYLNSSFYNVLDVNAIPDSLQFDWSDADLDVQGESLLSPVGNESMTHPEQIPSTRSSPQPSRKRTHSQTLTDHKPWSKMTNTEQMTTIQELSDVISHKMGLREQLEVIRIMNPRANVLHTDTEFVIDLDSLSDEKLARVREYVRQHTSRNENVSEVSSSNRNCRAQSAQHSKQLTKKQRKLQEKEERKRQVKEYRQMMKEKKSGLFVKEQVLSLACGDKDDVDDDIDILT